MITRRSDFGVVICAAAVLVVLDGMSSTASAAILSMTDVNSVFRVEPRDSANGGTDDKGAFSWQVDGTEHLFRQWFWYREDATPMTHEESIDNHSALPFISAFLTNTDTDPGADQLRLRYRNSVFELVVQYNLVGGSVGSQTSTINQTITITNRSSTVPLSFHFFEYHDFNLNDTAGDDTASLLSPSTIQQTDPTGMQVTTTVTTPVPNHYEIAPVPTTYGSLTDLSATTLSDTTPIAGPTDVAFAFEWDPIISPGGSFVIRLEQVIGPGAPGVIPEPGALLLVGSGLAGLYWRRRASGA